MFNAINMVRPLGILNKIFVLFLVLLPILNQYAISLFTALDYFVITATIFYVFKGKLFYQKNIWFYLFVVLSIITTLVGSYYLDEISVLHLGLKVGRFLLNMIAFYVIAPNLINYEYFYKVYTKIVLIVTVLLFVQLIYSAFTGKTLYLIFQGALAYGDTTGEMLNSIRDSQLLAGIYRASSVFLEPAWYALYILPWLGVTLARSSLTNLKKYYKSLILVTIGLFLCRSILGIVVAYILWWFYFLYVGIVHKKKKYMIISILVSVVATAFVLSIGSIYNEFANKFSSDSFTETSSTSLRLLRGIFVFSQFDLSNKLFGVGYGNITYHVKQFRIHTVFDRDIKFFSYMNGISTLFCYFGLMGGLLYCIFFSQELYCRNGSIILVVGWLLIMLGSDYYDNSFFVLNIVLMQSFAKAYRLYASECSSSLNGCRDSV